MATATRLDTDMSMWAPITHLYGVDDGTFLAVHVDGGLPDEVAGMIDETVTAMGEDARVAEFTVVTNPTTIVVCNVEGIALSLEVLHSSPPGTSHDDAVRDAGFTVA